MAMGSNPEMRRLERDIRLPAVDIGAEDTLETMEDGDEDLTVPAGVDADELALLYGESL